MRAGWAALALGGAACQSPVVHLSGTVFTDRDRGSAPLAGAELTVVEPFDDEVLDQVVTGADGGFQVTLPLGAVIAAEIRGPDLATTTFPGNAGIAEFAEIEDHTLYGVSLAELSAERSLFDGCAGADADGAAVFGEMRVFGLEDPTNGDNPIPETGLLDVRDPHTGEIWEACYLDVDGLAYDPDAERTGASGRFAAFGIDRGLHEINARYELLPEQWVGELYVAWVPSDDEPVAVPLWPVWVPFEL